MRYVDIEKAEYPYMSMSMFGINSKDCRIYNEGVKATKDMIQALPTADVVEVVRCKDCVHKFDIEGRCMCNINAEEAFGKWFGLRATHNEFYCAYGERRDT